MSFKERFSKGSRKPYARAHRVLRAYSQSGSADDLARLHAETAAMTILLQSAKDAYSVEPIVLTNERTRPAFELLRDSSITIAGVGMKRDDIASVEQQRHGVSPQYPFLMEERTGCCASVVNPNAKSSVAYSFEKWSADRLSAVEDAVKLGSDIICLGEFDYPPQHPVTDEKKFDQDILDLINGQNRPILCVAGSRHEWIRDGDNWRCINRARVFANKRLMVNDLQEPHDAFFSIDKAVSAKKAGEVLSSNSMPKIKYFETPLGKIAVLICVDVFSPSVVFSLLNSRSTTPNKPFDYVLVPAYNTSPKLYYSCQTLSLLCNTTVMLVDACKLSSGIGETRKEKQVAIFVAGRDLSDMSQGFQRVRSMDHGSAAPKLDDEPATENETVVAWRLSIDAVLEMKSDRSAIPFLSGLADNFFPRDPLD